MLKNRTFRLILAAFFAFCGASAAVADRGAFIINGSNAPEGEYPWMASISYKGTNPFYAHFCGAALIAPQYVVTAGHCVAWARPSDIQVLVGRTTLSNENGTIENVSGISVHPLYDSYLKINDIALVKLENPVAYPAVPLVESGDESLWTAGTISTILGWGTKNPDYPVLPDTLQQALIPIKDDTTCRDSIGRFFNPQKHLCAGILSDPGELNGVDTCNGDSGGPLVVPDGNGSWKIAGITSWGFGCASSFAYGVYTRIAAYSDWVYTFPPPAPYLETDVTLFGDPYVGETLTCDSGAWTGENIQFTYSWFQDDENSEEAKIDGQNQAQLTIVENLLGKFISCRVTASNGGGEVSADSDWSYRVVINDIRAPELSFLSADCKVGSCSLRYRAIDPGYSLGIARVIGRALYQMSKAECRKLGSGCKKINRVAAKYVGSGIYEVKLRPRAIGSYSLKLHATDNAGNLSPEVKTKIKIKKK
ncbi:serine protease [bacterium]|nr:serine protease [bacterium]